MAKQVLVSALILFFSGRACACSLAIHDWKLAGFWKIPIASPVFPFSEMNFLNANFKQKPAQTVLWVSDHGLFGVFLAGFIKVIPGLASGLDWSYIKDTRSVLALARQMAAAGQAPVVLGSDRNFLKIAFFSDRNSNLNCHQLVFMLNSRIRGVLIDDKQPWAQETNGMAWVSLIFYQIPLPGRILSLSFFPHDFTRISLFEDHSYVEELLGQKLLKRRLDLEVDPFVFDFPELPE
ncbi:MAG: hypothetical protein ACOYXC_07165 [Candidatus Rifleibacteriota bacterium]